MLSIEAGAKPKQTTQESDEVQTEVAKVEKPEMRIVKHGNRDQPADPGFPKNFVNLS